MITTEIERLFGNSTKAQACMLLGKNVSESQAADILGVSPGLISQYKEDSNFLEQVRLMQLESSLAASIRDEKIDELEDALLDRTKQILPFITKPMEVVGVLRTINSLQRRGTQAAQSAFANQQPNVATLTLPAFISNTEVTIRFNTNNEVIEVNDRPLTTMPAAAVGRLAEEAQQAKRELIAGTYTRMPQEETPAPAQEVQEVQEVENE